MFMEQLQKVLKYSRTFLEYCDVTFIVDRISEISEDMKALKYIRDGKSVKTRNSTYEMYSVIAEFMHKLSSLIDFLGNFFTIHTVPGT